MTAKDLLLRHDDKFIKIWLKEHWNNDNLGLSSPVFRKDLRISKKGGGYIFIRSIASRIRSICFRDGYMFYSMPISVSGLDNELEILGTDLRNNHTSIKILRYERSGLR